MLITIVTSLSAAYGLNFIICSKKEISNHLKEEFFFKNIGKQKTYNLGLSVTLFVGAEAKVHCDDHHQK